MDELYRHRPNQGRSYHDALGQMFDDAIRLGADEGPAEGALQEQDRPDGTQGGLIGFIVHAEHDPPRLTMVQLEPADPLVGATVRRYTATDGEMPLVEIGWCFEPIDLFAYAAVTYAQAVRAANLEPLTGDAAGAALRQSLQDLDAIEPYQE